MANVRNLQKSKYWRQLDISGLSVRKKLRTSRFTSTWTLIAEASGCTSSVRIEIAVVSSLNLFNHGTV